MMKSRIKLPILSLAFLLIAFLSSFGLSSEAWAICNNKCQKGWDACNAWCADHNKTTNSQTKCLLKCASYWDSGKNPQSIGPSDPSNARPGQSQVNPPPKAQ
jgi:hypothetical protein